MQGNLARRGQLSNSSANEPTAGKLVTHLRDLLLGSGYLATASVAARTLKRGWEPTLPYQDGRLYLQSLGPFYDCEAAMPSVLSCRSLPRRLS